MKTKIKTYKSGAWVTFEKAESNCAPYIVRLYNARDELKDKMRCDSYRAASEYFRAFCAIAKNQGVIAND